MSEQWVCSKFDKDQTEKWKVLREDECKYRVQAKRASHEWHDLPKSVYIPCPAPEQWAQVQSLIVDGQGDVSVPGFVSDGITRKIGRVLLQDGYRVLSLVVERRRHEL
ncbi:MAG: hypothetical protein OEV08_07460 [Nitrospira sp.]|nr:hypothetical protein [Nitrospira sp.]